VLPVWHKNRHVHELLREACSELGYEMLMVKNLWRGAVTAQRNTLSIGREFLDSSTEGVEPAGKQNNFVGLECRATAVVIELQVILKRNGIGGFSNSNA
jgi:hypothetical protein